MESKKEKDVYAENYKLRIKVEELQNEINSLKDKLSETLNTKLKNKVKELESEIDSLKDYQNKTFSYALKEGKDEYQTEELNRERDTLIREFFNDEEKLNEEKLFLQKRYYGWHIDEDGRIQKKYIKRGFQKYLRD
jgi:hypothetical protein